MIYGKIEIFSHVKSKFQKKTKKKQNLDSPQKFRRHRLSIYALHRAHKKDMLLRLFLSSGTISNCTPITNI